MGMGFELRASQLLAKGSTLEQLYQPLGEHNLILEFSRTFHETLYMGIGLQHPGLHSRIKDRKYFI
jgi:hypothetical protein